VKRLFRHLFTFCSAASLVLCIAVCVLWVRTGASTRTDSIVWGESGVYRLLEFSGDDAAYKILRDPGLPTTPRQWRSLPRGWLPPPRPSNPKSLPQGSVTWIMPSPSHLENGLFTQSNAVEAGSERPFAAASYGGVPRLGFEHASLNGWYGPGTSLTSYRFSYFLLLIPSAVLPAIWLYLLAIRRWRFGRFGPGLCRRCGYDLRASPERCPECGTAASAVKGTA
jgi:hypothetical protein